MMKHTIRLVFTAAAYLYSFTLHAQYADKLIEDLRAVHNNIKAPGCSSQQVISNRAMNIFLSDRVGSYLSGYKDLSLYKNNITFSSGDGIFSLNHNFFQAKGLDEPVREFLTVGIKTNAANAFAAAFLNKTFTNELGVTIKKSWISKPVTAINNCFEKKLADINREQQLAMLASAITNKETEFKKSLAGVKSEGMSDTVFATVKEQLTNDFYKNLQEEASRQFAEQQYRELAATERFKSIALNWTNFSVYLPVLQQQFVSAESLAAAAANKRSYPFEVSVNHSRFWETKKYGRLLLTLDATVFLNNSVQSQRLQALSYQEYKSAGGSDTLLLGQRRINSIYIGNFKNFVTPVVKFNFVYFPHASHIGISTSLEQNFGNYKALNFTLGIPVVLIDKTTAPAANFEFRVNFFDISHKVYPGRKLGDNISVGMTVGVPFSKIIY